MAIDCDFSFRNRGDKQRFGGQVINLSSKGILFSSSQNFEIGSTLDIILTPSNSLTPPMEASVIVTRVVENQPVYELACEIQEIK